MHVLLRQGGKWLTPERAGGTQLLTLSMCTNADVSTSTLCDSWITIRSSMFIRWQGVRCLHLDLFLPFLSLSCYSSVPESSLFWFPAFASLQQHLRYGPTCSGPVSPIKDVWPDTVAGEIYGTCITETGLETSRIRCCFRTRQTFVWLVLSSCTLSSSLNTLLFPPSFKAVAWTVNVPRW